MNNNRPRVKRALRQIADTEIDKLKYITNLSSKKLTPTEIKVINTNIAVANEAADLTSL